MFHLDDESHPGGGSHAQRHGLLQVHEAAAQKPRVVGAENVGDHQAWKVVPQFVSWFITLIMGYRGYN